MKLACLGWSLVVVGLVLAAPAPASIFAQEPAPAPPTEGPAPAEPAPPAPPESPAPAPAGDAEPPPPPPAEDAPPPPPPPPDEPPAQRFDGQVGGGGYAEETYPEDGDPDPVGDSGGGKFKMPGISIRIDPLNWLLDGRLGFELEVAPLDWLSIELVPVFVVESEPPTIDFNSLDEDISQHSNGLGSLAGTSLGVGFWLDGEAFRGNVLRLIFTNYGYSFKAFDSVGTFDSVDKTERRLMGFFGSYMRWSFFTIGGGLGLGYELNQLERCDLVAVPVSGGGSRITADPDADCDGELHLAAERDARPVADLNGFLHPVYLEGRISLGFIID